MSHLLKIIIGSLVLGTLGYLAWSSWFFWDRLQKSKELIATTRPFSATNSSPRILIAGDSTAVGVGASDPIQSVAGRIHQDYPTATITNIGISGLRTKQIIPVLQDIPSDSQYDLVILQIGGNDTVRWTNLSDLTADIDQALTIAQTIAPRVILLTSGNVGAAPIFPLPARPIYRWRTLQVRRIFMHQASQKDVAYVDLYRIPSDDPFLKNPNKYFAPDVFHPSGDGYGLWYERIQPVVTRVINSLP